jgi:hypothetical protein
VGSGSRWALPVNSYIGCAVVDGLVDVGIILVLVVMFVEFILVLSVVLAMIAAVEYLLSSVVVVVLVSVVVSILIGIGIAVLKELVKVSNVTLAIKDPFVDGSAVEVVGLVASLVIVETMAVMAVIFDAVVVVFPV